jgi:flagellar protein FliO/FliZ
MKKLILVLVLIPLFSLAVVSNEVAENSSSPVEASATSNLVESSPVVEVPTSSEVASTVQSEADIPVQLNADKKEAAQGRSWIHVVGGLLVCIGLFFGSIIFIRKYSLKNQKNPLHQMKVVTQYHLGPRKSLAVVRVAGESILIGVTDHHISLIKSLSLLDGDLVDTEEVPQNFKSTLKSQDPEAAEDFSIQGLQDVVKNKLKSMRNI